MNKKILDKEIIENVMKATGFQIASRFAKEIGYTKSSIYHVLKGINILSESMSNAIVLKFPQVNYNYLTKGEGEVLKKFYNPKDIRHDLSPKENNSSNSFLKLAEIPDCISRIEESIQRQEVLLEKILEALENNKISN